MQPCSRRLYNMFTCRRSKMIRSLVTFNRFSLKSVKQTSVGLQQCVVTLAGSTRSRSSFPLTQTADSFSGSENAFAWASLANSGLHNDRLINSEEIKKFLSEITNSRSVAQPTVNLNDVTYDAGSAAVQAFCTYMNELVHAETEQTDLKTFRAYIDTIDLNLNKLSQKDVILLLYSLSLSSPQTDGHGTLLLKLVKSLSSVCKKKLSTWDLNEAFQVGDAWFHLRTKYSTEYFTDLVHCYGSRLHKMNKVELVHLLFFVNLSRAFPPTLKQDVLERKLESLVKKFSVDEIAVVSMAFFKCKRAVQSEVLMLSILDHLVRNRKSVNEIALSAMLKTVRKSVEGKPKYAQHLKDLHKSFTSEIPRLNTWNCTHLLLSGSLLNLFHSQNVEMVTQQFLDRVPSLRLKDVERLLFVLAATGHDTPASELFWQKAEDELRQPRRRDELVAFARSFVSLLVYFATADKYPLDLFERVFQKDCFKRVLDSGYADTRRELLTLHCSLEIEQPQYQGPLLPAGLYEEITKAYRKPLPSWNTRNTFADNFLVDLLCSVHDSLGGSQYAQLQYTLPHYASPDVVFYADREGRPHPVSAAIQMDDTTSSGLQKCVLVPGARNMYLRGNSQPTGIFRMKLRQLEAVGFKVVHMAWFEYMLNTSKARLESVKRKLAPLVSTAR